MQGEVCVPYTPIGGNNMSRMAEPTISGSSQDPTGGSDQWIYVRWTLPGGISGKYLGWMHMLGIDKEYTDEDVNTYLEQKGITEDVNKINEINTLLYNYVHNMLFPTSPEYDYLEFYSRYQSCIHG